MATREHDFSLPGYTNTPRFSETSHLAAPNPGPEDDDEPAVRYKPSTRRHGAGAEGEDEEGQYTTYQNLLASLPSQQPGAATAGAIAMQTFGVISPELLQEVSRASQDLDPKSLMRTLTRGQLQRSKSKHHFTSSRKKSVMYRTLDALSSADEVEARQDIQDCKRMIALTKTAPAPMNKKIDMIKTEQEMMSNAKDRLTGMQLLMANLSNRWIHFKRDVHDAIVNVSPWEADIKVLAGRHGAVVGQFFRFLRWSMVLNFFIALIWICFVIVPYVTSIRSLTAPSELIPSFDSSFTTTDQFIGLFTGGAKLNYTAYFIGTYFVPYKSMLIAGASDQSFNSNYDVALAYLLTLSFFMLFTFIVIFHKVYLAVYNESLSMNEPSHALSETVFCSFDHSLTQTESVKLKRIGVVRNIKETLTEEKSKQEYDHKNKRNLYLKRVGTNLLVAAILGSSLYGVKASVDQYSANLDSYTRLIPSAILSFLNLALPVLFEMIGNAEEWRTELFLIQITVLRSMVTRVTGLFVFLYTVFLQRSRYMCWESFVGQYVYSLFVIGFILEILVSLGVDPTQRFMAARFEFIDKMFGQPRFDSIKNTIDLIYSQTIILFGTFFCPLLPLLGMAKCITLFYLKKIITMAVCAPPLRSFRARHSYSFLFFGFLLIMYFAVAFPLGYAIVNLPTSGAYQDSSTLDRFITSLSGPACITSNASCIDCLSAYTALSLVCWKPTGSTTFPSGVLVTMDSFCASCPSGCGPFRNLPTMYQAASNNYENWPSGARTGLQFIGTTSFAALILLILLIFVLFQNAASRARLALSNKLRFERDMERVDKLWILRKYAITLDDTGRRV